MTVNELIKKLADLPQEAEVYVRTYFNDQYDEIDPVPVLQDDGRVKITS